MIKNSLKNILTLKLLCCIFFQCLESISREFHVFPVTFPNGFYTCTRTALHPDRRGLGNALLERHCGPRGRPRDVSS